MKETKTDTNKTNEEITRYAILSSYSCLFHCYSNRGRNYVIDACIVRILKSRKRIPYTDLLVELSHQITFSLISKDVRKRIEMLIEREYIRRDEDETNLLHYVA